MQSLRQLAVYVYSPRLDNAEEPMRSGVCWITAEDDMPETTSPVKTSHEGAAQMESQWSTGVLG
jgi:hypothetical protein